MSARPRRALRVSAAIVPVLVVAVWALYLTAGRALIDAAWDGRGFGPLVELLARHRAEKPAIRTRAYYDFVSQLLLTRAVLIGLLAYLGAVAFVLRRQIADAARTYFAATGPALDLAVARIVLFPLLLAATEHAAPLTFAGFPRELMFPPFGAGLLSEVVPISPAIVGTALVAMRVTALMAAVGLFTRASAVAATLLGIYLLGVPQLFGKVNHYHHLVWFAAILAASPCGDALSIDALARAARTGRSPGAAGPTAWRYAFPLRVIWLLLGLIYFFPGFRKLWGSGIDWIVTDSLKYIMYAKWMEFPDWTPWIRVDAHPLLYRPAAFATIAFELGFVALVLSARTRLWAAGLGLVFHNLTGLFMRISFWQLQICYVTLVGWSPLAARVGRRLYADDARVIYDGTCGLCRRTVAALQTLDVFGRLTWVDGGDRAALARHGLDSLGAAALARDLWVVRGARRDAGFHAYRVMAWRIPALWPILPLLYVWPAPAVGERVYRRVADSRHCALQARLVADVVPAPARTTHAVIVATAAVLLVVNGALGVLGIDYAWPLAQYPSFADRGLPTEDTITVALRTSAGIVPVELRQVAPELSPERLAGLVWHILGTPDTARQRRQLAAFWRISAMRARRDGATSVLFYRDAVSVIPAERARNPLRRTLVAEIPL